MDPHESKIPTIYTHHISALLTDIDFTFEAGRTRVESFTNLVSRDERAGCNAAVKI